MDRIECVKCPRPISCYGLTTVTLKRIAIGFLVAGVLFVGWLVFPRNPNRAFVKAIADSNRIVIRFGGSDCCGNDVDSQPVILEITDPDAIAEFNANIKFRRSVSRSWCMCCGYPGIDWYRNGERIVLTSVQHGEAIRWSGFMCDEPLTDNSAEWLRSFFEKRGIPEEYDFALSDLDDIINTTPDEPKVSSGR